MGRAIRLRRCTFFTLVFSASGTLILCFLRGFVALSVRAYATARPLVGLGLLVRRRILFVIGGRMAGQAQNRRVAGRFRGKSRRMSAVIIRVFLDLRHRTGLAPLSVKGDENLFGSPLFIGFAATVYRIHVAVRLSRARRRLGRSIPATSASLFSVLAARSVRVATMSFSTPD